MKAGLIDDQGDQQGDAEEQQTGGEGSKALDEQIAETAEVRIDEVFEMRGMPTIRLTSSQMSIKFRFQSEICAGKMRCRMP